MVRVKQETKVFSPFAFGKKLRSERRIKGYSNTKKFSEAIQERTGVFIDFDTLMKYERGEREPDITKLMAISFALYENRWLKGLENLLIYSMPLDSVTSLSMQVEALDELYEELNSISHKLKTLEETRKLLLKEIEEGIAKPKEWNPQIPESFEGKSIETAKEKLIDRETKFG